MKVNNNEVPGNMYTEEECENMKTAVSRFGVQVVCSEEDEKADADFVLPGGEGCENIKKVASKVGYQVVCDDEDEK